MWHKMTYEEYQNLLESKGSKDFSRHDDFNDYLNVFSFGAQVRDYDRKLDGTPEIKAPLTTSIKSYKLTFGKNKNLASTESSKIVSGH